MRRRFLHINRLSDEKLEEFWNRLGRKKWQWGITSGIFKRTEKIQDRVHALILARQFKHNYMQWQKEMNNHETR